MPSTCPHCSPLPRLMPEVPLPCAPCSCPALPLTHILLLPQPSWSLCPGQALWLCLSHDHGQGPFRSPSYLGHICSLWIEKSHSVRAEVLEGCVPRVLTCPPVPSPAPSPAPACLHSFSNTCPIPCRGLPPTLSPASSRPSSLLVLVPVPWVRPSSPLCRMQGSYLPYPPSRLGSTLSLSSSFVSWAAQGQPRSVPCWVLCHILPHFIGTISLCICCSSLNIW